MNGERLGGYILLERIGRGGMSSVYRAVAESGGDEVAIKILILDSEQEENAVFRARFEREAQIINDLHHDHILPMLDIGQEDDRFYYVMPLIRGGTLVDLIRRGGLDLEAISYWLSQICSALDHAHDMQVIHRDLKPSNVLLDEIGNAYLTDFGIAKLTTHTSHLTQTGIVIGTPAYMAPEQWRDDLLDRRTDVYGLGIMTYLMLTTHTPFESETAHAMMYQHLNEKPPSPKHYRPNITASIEAVIMKALNKVPDNRQGTAGAFAEDFRQAVEGRPNQAVSPTSDQPELPPPVYRYPIPDHLRNQQRSHPPSRWWFVGLGTVLLVVAIGVIGVLLLMNAGGKANSESPPTPTLSIDPQLDIPRIRLESPQKNASVSLGENVNIQLTVFDRVGVTRIELRYFGAMIDELTAPTSTGEKTLAATFTFTPDTVGQNRLELIAFRGEVASDSEYITLDVSP
jgi:serine/threonine protein kinase